MERVRYTLDEHVAVVSLQDGENRFNPDFLNACLETLDRVERETDARTLVVRSAHPHIFSNGIDLNWLVPVLAAGRLEEAKGFFQLLNRLLRRTLTYPMITIAAVNGHAFAGGAIWCCAFDFRFMRSDRGFLCLPEVDLCIPFLPGMNAILKKAIALPTLEEMQYTGRRLTGQECRERHIASGAFANERLMDEVLGYARGLKKERAIVAELKLRLHREILRVMDEEDPPYIASGRYHVGAGQMGVP